MKRVVIIQAEMKRYRIPFFIGLYKFLQEAGIDLTVLYSNSNRLHAMRQDSADLPEPVGKKVSGYWFFRKLLYQDVWRYVMASDLIIVGPEIKYLMNPFILFLSAIGMKRVAFWGLGPNRHPGRSPLAEWVKQFFFNRVNWWFAYTETIAGYLKDRGIPAERITNVQNATDSNELRQLISEIGEDEARSKSGVAHGRAGSDHRIVLRPYRRDQIASPLDRRRANREEQLPDFSPGDRGQRSGPRLA